MVSILEKFLGDFLSVVGANAVVTKDVAPMTIVTGAPAKPIGIRK